MKLIIAIVQNDDERALLNKLMKEGFRATKLASTGGFLRTGNTTLMLGVEDDRLDEALDLIRETCKTRNITLPSYPYAMETGMHVVYPVETKVGGATVFVMPIEQNFTM
jgi:uncharacterized protein YaaQ